MIYNELTMPLIVCTEVESKTQGSRPRQRTQKNFEAKAKDRDARGQGQGPRTQTQVFPPKKKDLQNFFSSAKGLQKFIFRRSLLEETKKGLCRFSARFLAFSNEISATSSRGQANFRGLEASRPRPRTSKCVLEAKDVLEDSTSGVYYVQFSS